MLLLAFACAFFAFHGYEVQKRFLNGMDFKPVYSSARCLLAGCNPYDEDETREQFLTHGGPPDDLRAFRPYNANYPPTALALVTPLAALPYPMAHAIWLWMGMALFSVAVFLMADLCFPRLPWAVVGLLALFVATSLSLTSLAQPAMYVIALLCLAVWCFVRQRIVAVGILAMSISLAFKPHLGALLWLYFFMAGGLHRKRAWQVLWMTLLIALPGIAWASLMPASRHWVHDLSVNLAGIAARGSASDPGPANPEAPSIANLQSLTSLLQDNRPFYNLVAYAVSAVLLAIWAVPVLRMRNSPRKDLLAIATASCLAILPIYHREYDTRLLLLAFPALALVFPRRRLSATIAFAIGLLMVGLTSFYSAISKGPSSVRLTPG